MLAKSKLCSNGTRPLTQLLSGGSSSPPSPEKVGASWKSCTRKKHKSQGQPQWGLQFQSVGKPPAFTELYQSLERLTLGSEEMMGRAQTLLEVRAVEETGKTSKAQVPRLPPHPHPVPWSLLVHGCCTSCLQFLPARRLRVHLISHLWPLGWETACRAGSLGMAPSASDQCLRSWCPGSPHQ